MPDTPDRRTDPPDEPTYCVEPDCDICRVPPDRCPGEGEEGDPSAPYPYHYHLGLQLRHAHKPMGNHEGVRWEA